MNFTQERVEIGGVVRRSFELTVAGETRAGGDLGAGGRQGAAAAGADGPRRLAA